MTNIKQSCEGNLSNPFKAAKARKPSNTFSIVAELVVRSAFFYSFSKRCNFHDLHYDFAHLVGVESQSIYAWGASAKDRNFYPLIPYVICVKCNKVRASSSPNYLPFIPFCLHCASSSIRGYDLYILEADAKYRNTCLYESYLPSVRKEIIKTLSRIGASCE